MKKVKIAISLDKAILDEIDSRVDGQVMRSRSQAIEVFLRRGLFESEAKDAVILLKGEHQRYALADLDGKPLIHRQVEMLAAHGIEKVLVLTQSSESSIPFNAAVKRAKLPITVVEDASGGNARALAQVRARLTHPFVVLAGDTFTEFDLTKMIRRLLSSQQIAIMGLMSRSEQGTYGVAELDGDLVVRFEEKPHHGQSYVVNAGVYAFKPQVFELFGEGVRSLERDLFPALAQRKSLLGFFTHGRYAHLPEESDKAQDTR